MTHPLTRNCNIFFLALAFQSLQIVELKPEMGLRLWHLVPERGKQQTRIKKMDKALGPKQDKNRTRRSLWFQKQESRTRTGEKSDQKWKEDYMYSLWSPNKTQTRMRIQGVQILGNGLTPLLPNKKKCIKMEHMIL